MSPRASASLGGYLSAARALEGSPLGPPRARAAAGLGRGRRAALRSPVPYLHPSALPVPYQCLTSALPSALPREPYEFTRRARPIFQINSPALPEEENFCVSEAAGV